MPLAHRGDPVGVVLLRVVLRTDPEEAAVEQPHRRREHLLARHALAPRGPSSTRSRSRGQRPREVDHLLELLARRAARATCRGSGTACARRRRSRWPGCGPSDTGRSRRPPRRAGSRARESARARSARSTRLPVVVEVLEALAAPAAANAGSGAVDSLRRAMEL